MQRKDERRQTRGDGRPSGSRRGASEGTGLAAAELAADDVDDDLADSAAAERALPGLAGVGQREAAVDKDAQLALGIEPIEDGEISGPWLQHDGVDFFAA